MPSSAQMLGLIYMNWNAQQQILTPFHEWLSSEKSHNHQQISVIFSQKMKTMIDLLKIAASGVILQCEA